MRECIYVARPACGGGIDLLTLKTKRLYHVDHCIPGVASGGFRTDPRWHCDVNLPGGLTLPPVVGPLRCQAACNARVYGTRVTRVVPVRVPAT